MKSKNEKIVNIKDYAIANKKPFRESGIEAYLAGFEAAKKNIANPEYVNKVAFRINRDFFGAHNKNSFWFC